MTHFTVNYVLPIFRKPALTHALISLSRMLQVPDAGSFPSHASLPVGFKDTAGGGALRPSHHQRVASAPAESATASFVNKLLGASSPFTEVRHRPALDSFVQRCTGVGM